jgi:predicted AlkP superfamily phosphohydrolase/phosphomutase
MNRPSPVVLLGFDAMDPQLTAGLAAAGRLPTFAGLLESSTRCPIRNPVGLFVGSLWSSFFTARTAAHTGFHCWEEIVPGSYEKRVTSPRSIAGRPFWETLSDAGRQVAILDVPHSRAGYPLGDGIQISEWGAHDRHFGLRSYPDGLAAEVVERFGFHPILGVDGLAERDWAPDDWVLRAGPLRTADEEAALLEGLLAGARTKSRLSAGLLAEREWDLFFSVFAETHCVGHQSWHVRDRDHPRHDPVLLERLGDPVARVYEQMDRTLADHLAAVGDDATVLVLLSHGMGAHHDGTHLLAEILRRLHKAYCGDAGRSWQGHALGRAWTSLGALGRGVAGRPLAAALSHRAARRNLRPASEEDSEAERREQPFFICPNNYVYGGIRINLRGRESAGKVAAGAELDELCGRLREDLLALVNVETGGPVIRAVERTDAHYDREPLDSLPDLLIDWNHDHAIETIWSPRFGLLHGPYTHWRTGDHKPGGMLLARGPGIGSGYRPEGLDIEDLAPSLAARLGVALDRVDGSPVDWLSRVGEAASAPSVASSA